ncbi:multicopper oxidase domain-containing protein [Arthrobacter monumenti]
MTTSAHEHFYDSQVDFSSNQNQEENPVTEYWEQPDVSIELDVFRRDLRFDDGAVHEIMSFNDDAGDRAFPGPLIRLKEGQLFHGTTHPSKGPHTTHWHGLEPDPRNDGVGHTSFEIEGQYTYQWLPEVGWPGDPNLGSAGTYFYHCHVNTTLHVQLGMFGPLIIDPVVHPVFPVTEGVTRRIFIDGPEYDIDTETLIAPYSVDPRWHDYNHAEGLSGEDVGLNNFRPTHFYLLGGELAHRPGGEHVWSLQNMRANVAGGDRAPTLLRLLNCSYSPNTMRFTDSNGKPVKMAELISHDGRAFRETSRYGPCRPCHFTDYPMMTSIVTSGAAERYDMLLHPPEAGTYYLTMDFHNWIDKTVLGSRTVEITAT